MRNMYRIIILSLICMLAFYYEGYCQRDPSENPVRNSIYAEGALQGSPYTINYDRIFHIGEKVSYAYRTGFSYAKEYITLPVGISALMGSGAHHLEFGVTIIPYLNTHDAKNDPTNLFIYAIPAAGYRYQKPEGGLFFKVSAGPAIFWNPPADNVFKVTPKIYAYGSIALGMSF